MLDSEELLNIIKKKNNIMEDEGTLDVYTDGSSFGSPRVGGIGIRFLFPEKIKDLCPFGYPGATNNQMELKACIFALQEIIKSGRRWSRIIIHTDSLHIVSCRSKAMFEWPKNKWMKRNNAPVMNADLWKDFNRCVKNIRARIDIAWVKGHSKNEHNKAVDKLAKQSAKKARNSPLNSVLLGRKTVSKGKEVGGIKMDGQRLSIRIFTAEYLKVQKIHKYKYEVLSKNSPYYSFSGIIFSDIQLDNRHKYSVRFNKNNDYPKISKVFKEIPL